MKYLIVEDDINKANSLISFIKTKYEHTTIVQKSSYQSGIKEILKNAYDIILLDMSMPTFDITPEESGGRPIPLAGREILYRMKRYNLHTSVIIVTQYEEFEGVSLNSLGEELNELFPNIYKGFVYYNPTHDNWKNDLFKLIEQVKD
jgi:DNA-binding NarL/FixJ family response regulator